MAQTFEAFLNTEILGHDAVLSSENFLLGHYEDGRLDNETAKHSLSVALGAGAVAYELGLETPRIIGLYVAGHVHDIAKVHHNNVYTSAKKLTKKDGFELHVRDTHAYRGYCMCMVHWESPVINGPEIVDADIERYGTVITLGHHLLFKIEPRRLKSRQQLQAYVQTKDITLFEATNIIDSDGRIFTRVDVTHALQSDRPYHDTDAKGIIKLLTPEEKRIKAFKIVQRDILPIKGLTTQELFDILDAHKELIDFYTQRSLGKIAVPNHASL